MYDVTKEKDRDVLIEFTKHLQQELLFARRKIAELHCLRLRDEDICLKLSEELFNIRKKIFDSKQEKKANKPKNHKKRKNGKLVHNKGKELLKSEEEIDLSESIIKYDLNHNCCPKCNGINLNEIDNCFEESSEFEVIERQYILKRHLRKKYSCKDCQNIITAPGGVKLTPGGEYSIQLATQIACDKFEDHIPLERQRKQMKRAGLNVEVSTLYGLTEHLYNRLRPLEDMIKNDIYMEKWIHVDESPITFYNPKKSKGFIWSMSNPKGAYYQFEPTRSGLVAKEMLKNYNNGNVVTDGFSGYSFIEDKKNINHAFCWAHVRRKFFEAMSHDPQAEIGVDLIDELYKVEHLAQNLKELAFLRSSHSREIIKTFDDWIDSLEGKYLNELSLGKAINYYIKRKKGLHLFLKNENIPIDNNQAERRQRCPVMGRKNFLHFKSINGADVGAFFYSVIESCKSNGLNPRAYINDMAHRSANEEELLSPYHYVTQLNEKLLAELSSELKARAEQFV